MASYNQDRFFYSTFDTVVRHFEANEKEKADELCAELVFEFQCPRLVQVQAWQLRSLCTTNYFIAKAHLQRALALLDTLDESLEVERQAMFNEWQETWERRWAAEGLEQPQEEPVEDTYVAEDPETQE